MARRARRKQSGVIGTLVVELSALAGILGIAQPAVRNNLWSLVNPRATANAPLNSLSYPAPAMSPPTPWQYPFNYSAPSVHQPAPQFAHQQPAQERSLQQQSIQQPFPPNAATATTGVYPTAPTNNFHPPTFTAQATLPPNPTKRPLWQASVFSPMGGYQ